MHILCAYNEKTFLFPQLDGGILYFGDAAESIMKLCMQPSTFCLKVEFPQTKRICSHFHYSATGVLAGLQEVSPITRSSGQEITMSLLSLTTAKLADPLQTPDEPATFVEQCVCNPVANVAGEDNSLTSKNY